MRAVRFARSWRSTSSSLVVAAIVFVVPFVFILLTAAKDRAEAAQLEFSPAERAGSSSTTSRRSSAPATTCMVTALQQQHCILTVGSVTLIVVLVGDGRLRAAAPPRPAGRRSSTLLMLAGLDHPAGRRARRSGCCRQLGLFKTLPGPDPGRGRLPDAVLRPALPGLRLDDPAGARRGRDHRRRRPRRRSSSG